MDVYIDIKEQRRQYWLSNKKLVRENRTMKNYKIAVAGTGYVGLSLGVLLGTLGSDPIK